MRPIALLAALVLAALNVGCSVLAPQEPFQPGESQVTSFRGSQYWTAPGGFDGRFWKGLAP